jgi:radical SAM protein with 4Fe4S-binding SPASM domain
VRPDSHFSGGEPTIRRDLVQLVEHVFAANQGDALLFTNGTRWRPGLAQALKAAGLRWVQISLEGPEALNDAVRGVYRDAMATLHHLRALDFRVTVSITLTAQNIAAVPDFVRDLDALGLHFHLREVLALGSGTQLQALTSDQRRKFSEWAVAYAGAATVGVEDPVHCSVDHAFARTQTGCVAGRNHLCIDVDGSVYPCRPLRHRVGHVDDLRAAWQHPDMQRLRQRQLYGRCGRCELRWHCGGCRLHAHARGDLCGEDDRCFADENGLLMPAWQGRALLAAERVGWKLRHCHALSRLAPLAVVAPDAVQSVEGVARRCRGA